MDTPENYSYSAACFRILADSGIFFRNWLYDINCQWGDYNRRCVITYPDWDNKPGLRQAASETAFPVPCWHAGMHNKACRQENTLANPRFAVDLQANGEPAEQAWSQGGANKAGRYLRHDSHSLHHEGSLQHLTLFRDERISRTLQRRAFKLMRNLRAIGTALEIAVADMAPSPQALSPVRSSMLPRGGPVQFCMLCVHAICVHCNVACMMQPHFDKRSAYAI